jgi:hypothetical protein
MERVVERGNVVVALKRVQKNKGSPGIDGMTVLPSATIRRKTSGPKPGASGCEEAWVKVSLGSSSPDVKRAGCWLRPRTLEGDSCCRRS